MNNTDLEYKLAKITEYLDQIQIHTHALGRPELSYKVYDIRVEMEELKEDFNDN